MRLVLLYIPMPLLELLLVLMLRNRAYRVCPAFFTYVAFGVCADILRFVVHNRPHAYYWVYWATETGYCLLGIVALYEVLRSALRPRSWPSRLFFPGIVASATVLTFAHTNSVAPQLHGFFVYIITGEIIVRFAQVIVFIVVGFLAAFARLRWYQLGVAAGFGFYSAIELSNMIAISDFGAELVRLRDVFSIAAYSIAILIWIWFFRVPVEKEPSPQPRLVPHCISLVTQYWNRASKMRKAKVLALLHLTSHPERS